MGQSPKVLRLQAVVLEDTQTFILGQELQHVFQHFGLFFMDFYSESYEKIHGTVISVLREEEALGTNSLVSQTQLSSGTFRLVSVHIYPFQHL